MDILDSLIKYYDNDRAMAYEELQDFLEEVIHNPKQTVERCNEYMHEDAVNNGICPLCFRELKTKPRVANHLEYQGVPCNEYQYIKYCPSCGWTDEDD